MYTKLFQQNKIILNIYINTRAVLVQFVGRKNATSYMIQILFNSLFILGVKVFKQEKIYV